MKKFLLIAAGALVALSSCDSPLLLQNTTPGEKLVITQDKSTEDSKNSFVGGAVIGPSSGVHVGLNENNAMVDACMGISGGVVSEGVAMSTCQTLDSCLTSITFTCKRQLKLPLWLQFSPLI